MPSVRTEDRIAPRPPPRRRPLPVGRALVAIASSWAGGCWSVVVEPAASGQVTAVTLRGEVEVVTAADFLFVVDDSASMAGEHRKLQTAVPALVDGLRALSPAVDARASVLTSSVEERFGPCSPDGPAGVGVCRALFGGAVDACTQGTCVRTDPRGGRLRTDGAGAVVSLTSGPRDASVDRLQQLLQVGVDGTRQEQPLRAVRLAWEQGSLDALWRPRSRTVVVFVSDEDDCSDSRGALWALERTATGWIDHCEQESRAYPAGGLDDPAAWLAQLRHRQPLATVAVIAGLVPATRRAGLCSDTDCVTRCGQPSWLQNCERQCTAALQPSRCSDECRLSCEQFCGAQAPARRLEELARRAQGPTASVCASDYGPALARLARVAGIPSELELPSVPVDERTVELELLRAGRLLMCGRGTDYVVEPRADPPLVRISETGGCRLRPGDEWTLRYIATPVGGP